MCSRSLLVAVLAAASACSPRPPAAAPPGGLEIEFAGLLARIDREPTTADSLGARSALLWRWSNALALAGRALPPNLPADLGLIAWTEAMGAVPGGVDLTLDQLPALIDGYTRELALEQREPSAFGSWSIAPAGPFEIEGWVTLEMTYTVGSRGMAIGGGLLLGRQPMADHGRIQINDQGADHHASVRTARSGARFVAATRPLRGLHGGTRSAEPAPAFILEGAALAPGDTVTLTIGDRRGGGRGLRLQSTSTDQLLFPVYVDIAGDGWFLAPSWPGVAVRGGALAAIRAVAPSIVRPGEPFTMAIRCEDRWGNRAAGAMPALELLRGGAIAARVGAGGGAIALVELALAEPGVHRLEVRSSDGALRATSNPIWVENDPARRVFWGETHGHTALAEGQGTAEEYFRYGFEDARLDFLTLSEHDLWLDDREWQRMRELTRAHNQPGERVAFLGSEWTSPRELGGHHNVFYRRGDAQRTPTQAAPLLGELYRRLRATNATGDVLVIPHAHVAGDWNQSDSAIERLVEIASMHGTFEFYGNKYLRNGFRVGFVGAADDHRSKPGLTMTRNEIGQAGGLAAVYAREKTGDAIFDALRARATYATLGQRILLEAALNGRPPGTHQPATGRRALSARVSGTAAIDQVDVIKNGEVIWSRRFAAAPLAERSFLLLGFESTSDVFGRALDNPRPYRVWQGELELRGARLLGVTPIGFTNRYRAQAEVDPARPGVVRFQTATRGKRDTLVLEVSGASSSTVIAVRLAASEERRYAPVLVRPAAKIPAASFELSLAELSDQRLEHTLPVDVHTDRVTLQVVDPAAALDQTIEFSDLDADAAGADYYYLRVTQIDGGRAWSSPFWVGGPPG